MNADDFSVAQLLAMRHSPVRNYVIPGLTSWLIGEPSPMGTVRLFECERNHQESITPHSHRFSFQCWVLAGNVRNRIWTEVDWPQSDGLDRYMSSIITYDGEIGRYKQKPGAICGYEYRDMTYSAGKCYRMEPDEIHSIFFSKGTQVLFFEGPTVSDSSVILEPYVNGGVVPTFEVRSWMFQKNKIREAARASAVNT